MLDLKKKLGVAQMGKLIPLTQWAINHGITPDTARQRANRGVFQTAQKLGRDWVIDEDEELIDHRRRTTTQEE